MSSLRKLSAAVLVMLSCFCATASEVTVTKPYFRWLFGGFGFHNAEANFGDMMTDEFKYQREFKSFAEISPSFSRVFGAYAASSKDQLDRFADFYDMTFAKAGTIIYLVPGCMPVRPEDEDVVSAKEYAAGVANSLDYLIKDRGCRQIAYFCLTNELKAAGRFAWFRGGYDVFDEDRLNLYKKWTIECYNEFVRKGLDIRCIGSDVTASRDLDKTLKIQQWTADNMDEWLDGYVSHWYVYGHAVDELDMWDRYNEYFAKEVALAISKGKRYILGEYGFSPVFGKKGVMTDDAGHTIRQPETAAEGALCKAEVGLAAMNQGAYSAISWSFADFPDPFCYEDSSSPEDHMLHEAGLCITHPDAKYNKWGMFNWSEVDHDYSAKPEYYVLGYMAKLFRKNSTVLTCVSSNPLIRTGAVLNPDRSFSMMLINRGEADEIVVDCSSWAGQNGINSLAGDARVYVYDSANPPYNEFNDLQDYSAVVKAEDGRLALSIPAKSAVFVTTDYKDRVPSEVKGLKIIDGKLTWDETADEEHRYYRVFRDGKQIASTVATWLPVDGEGGEYAVISVDAWGNAGKFSSRDGSKVYTPATELTMVNKLIPTVNPFARLDVDKYPRLDYSERLMASNCTGLTVAFTTDSPMVGVRASLSWCSDGTISAPNSTRGFDLYVEKDGDWIWAGTVAMGREPDVEMDYILSEGLGNAPKKCLLYLPHSTHLKSLELITEKGSGIAAVPSPFKGRIAVFGSSFTHGAGCSRCGMSYTAQLSRMTGYNFINFGFSGHCLLQDYFADILVEAEDVDAYVFDGFSNPWPERISEALFPFIEKFQAAKPGVPLIFMKTIYREVRLTNEAADRKEARKMELADSLMRIAVKKYNDVYWVTSTDATGKYHECTVDGVHPDNHGYTLWAESVKDDIVKILRKYIKK